MDEIHHKSKRNPKYLNVPWKILGNEKLRLSARVLLAYLIFRQGKNSKSYWSQVVMAEELGTSRKTIQRDLRDLVKGGYISVKLIRKGESFRNEYSINNVFPQGQIDAMENLKRWYKNDQGIFVCFQCQKEFTFWKNLQSHFEEHGEGIK